jgi:hypothetical protein
MDAKTRAEIRKACAAATPGPWVEGVYGVFDSAAEDAAYVADCESSLGPDVAAANRVFIAGARRWVPALLDALEAAEAERDRLRAESDLYRHGYQAMRAADISEYLALCGSVRALVECHDADGSSAVAAFRRSPPPDLRVIHDGAGRVTRLLLAGEVVE